MRTVLLALLSSIAACSTQGHGGAAGDDVTGDDANGGGGGKDAGVDARGGGGGGEPPEFTSGTRIKVRVMTTPDGARAAAGYYDQALNVPCQFMRAADDVPRCLPSTSAYVAGYYADAACTVPLAYTSGAGCAQTHALAFETAPPCTDVGYPSAQRYRVYPVTGAYALATLYYRSTTCTIMDTPATLTFYRVGAELAATSFVRGTLELAP